MLSTAAVLHLCLRDWNNQDFAHFSLNKGFPRVRFLQFYPDWRLSRRRASPCQSTSPSPGQQTSLCATPRATGSIHRTSPQPHCSCSRATQVPPRFVLTRADKKKRRNMNFPSSSAFAGKAFANVPLVMEGTPLAHSSVFPLQSSDKTQAAALATLWLMSADVQHLGIWLMNSTKEIPKYVSKMAAH